MMHKFIRVIRGDNGALSDYSLLNQDPSSTMDVSLVKDEDYLYIGKFFPFNNFYAIMGSTLNAVTASIKIEYWEGDEWVEVVDILDGTSSNGVPLAKSGAIQFTTDEDKRWSSIDDTSESPAPDDLRDVTIYNLYWLRISFTETLTSGALLDKITYAFTEHERLVNIDHTVNNYLTSFGVTDWTQKIITASEHIVQLMNQRGLIKTEGQILNFEDVSLATEYKTLALIYASLGKSFVTERDYYNNLSGSSFSNKVMSLDTNYDGHLQESETVSRQQRLVR